MRISMIIVASVILIAMVSLLLFAPMVRSEKGLIKLKSHHSVKETADRLESSIKDKGITLFLRVNHAENAKKVEMELRETELLIFGNPRIGTPLMKSNQTIGIDLPQKALIWKDEAGQVWIAYNDPKYLAERHDITERDEVIKKVGMVLSKLAEEAAGTDSPKKPDMEKSP